jgi:hypothetical protein
MSNPTQKTKTKTAVAVALVTFAVVSSVAAATIIIRRNGGTSILQSARNIIVGKATTSVTTSTPTTNPAPAPTPTPTPNPMSEQSGEVPIDTDIQFNGPNLNEPGGPTNAPGLIQRILQPDETLYFTLTIPATVPGDGYADGPQPVTVNSVRCAAASVSQNTVVNMYIMQRSQTLTPALANAYYADFQAIAAFYGAGGYEVQIPHNGKLDKSLALKVPATAPTVWTELHQDTVGGVIDLHALTPANAARFATDESYTKTLPGKYYVAVKNVGTLANTVHIACGRSN